jgi:hypothetical protein
MYRGMGCLGSSSSQNYASARQSSNATTIKTIKISETNIRSSDASNNKAVDTKQRKFLVYPQEESSFGGLLQPSSISWESPEVPAFGRGDLDAQQFSFDTKSFSSEKPQNNTPFTITCRPESCSFIQSFRTMESDSGTRLSSGIENTI